MHPIYHPLLNRIARSVLKPFAGSIPQSLQFPVTGVIRVRLPEGRQILMDTNPTSYLTKVLFWRGFEGFEAGYGRLFIALARQAKVIVDIGANIGYYSLIAAVFNPEARIFGFEPLPDALVYFNRNIQLNGFENIVAADVALSNGEGTTTFFVTRNPKFPEVEHHITGTSALDREHAAGMNLVTTVEVRMQTLDAYVEANVPGSVDLIKLDVEGAEHLVLGGSEQVLRDHRPIILCEVLPGEEDRRVEDILARHDYSFYRAEEGGLVWTEHLHHQSDTTKDYLMVPSEGREKVASFIR